MLLDCVAHGEMTSLEDYTDLVQGMPLCVVPLLDLDGRVHGLFVVLDMPFVDFHEGQLQLLSVIGARLGEHLAVSPRDEQALHTSLARWQQHVRRNRVEAVAITLTLTYPVSDEQARDISAAIDEQRRGLDECFALAQSNGQRSWVTIMPLTGERALGSYRERMQAALGRLFEDPAVPRSMRLQATGLDGRASVASLLEALRSMPPVTAFGRDSVDGTPARQDAMPERLSSENADEAMHVDS